jgi:hypothetical protein
MISGALFRASAALPLGLRVMAGGILAADPRVKQETYNTLSFQEFDEIVADHLGVDIQRPMEGKNDGYSLQQDLLHPNDSYILFHPEDYAEPEDDIDRGEPLTYEYAEKLFRMGVLPSDHKLIVWVSW